MVLCALRSHWGRFDPENVTKGWNSKDRGILRKLVSLLVWFYLNINLLSLVIHAQYGGGEIAEKYITRVSLLTLLMNMYIHVNVDALLFKKENFVCSLSKQSQMIATKQVELIKQWRNTLVAVKSIKLYDM